MSKGLCGSSNAAKFRFLRSSVQTVASLRWARWPYQARYAKRLDSIQRKMLASLFGIKPSAQEPYDAFVQRRHIQAGHLGRWSAGWGSSVVSWHDHLLRRHDPKVWSPVLLDWHDTSWLSLQGLMHSVGLESRTRTRAYRGKVHRRWQESLDDAKRFAA